MTPLLATPYGRVEYRVTGTGHPVTVVAPGLAESIDTTRPFVSGVGGTRVLLHLRGHGATRAGGGDEHDGGADDAATWSYGGLAADIAAVADEVGATRALGVSLGAGALCALVAAHPDRFDRLVLVLPAALDRRRDDLAASPWPAVVELVERGDPTPLAAAFLGGLEPELQDRPEVHRWARARADVLLAAGPDAVRLLRALPRVAPLADRAALAAVRAPTLVVGQEGDPLHPAGVARELAAALPDARLAMFDGGGLLWAHRAKLRDVIRGFLS